MLQEDKNLLLKDLCERLPYEVKVIFWSTDKKGNYKRKIGTLVGIDNRLTIELIFKVNHSFARDSIETSKPYLRPMSSMTEEEFFRYKHLDLLDYSNDWFEMPNFRGINWLNAHHFDFRGLISMGLAIEAPKDMYKTE